MTKMSYPTVALVILDGFGHGSTWGGNAISQAHAPTVSWLAARPRALLGAAGPAVGLGAGEIGNSEVGHLNLGAGRVVVQESATISAAIADGSFTSNPTLSRMFDHLHTRGGRLHLVGLLSRATVHANRHHLSALLAACRAARISRIFLHAITDGRDSDPRDGLGQLLDLERELQTVPGARIATVTGRYWAMDRDQHFDRTARAFEAIAAGRGRTAASARLAISQAYSQKVTDEFIEPAVVTTDGGAYRGLETGDVILFWNFRPDRMRQLVRALVDPSSSDLPRRPLPADLRVFTLTNYGAEEKIPGLEPLTALEPIRLPLAEVVSRAGLAQFHIAETEKYAHVTYFFNGGREAPFPLEERLLVPSLKTPTFDAAPAMQARQITDEILKRLRRRPPTLVVANYANADMVGHTGNFQATLKAVETLDAELKRLVMANAEHRWAAVITADHGNAEEMVNPQTGEPSTGHTVNPVPCWVIRPEGAAALRPQGILADVAPTVLDLLGLEKPKEMTGQSLLSE